MMWLTYVGGSILISGVILWISAKITGVNLTFRNILIVVAIANLLTLIPVLGHLFGLIGFFMTLKYFTQLDIWPNLVLLTIINQGLTVLIMMIIIDKFFVVT